MPINQVLEPLAYTDAITRASEGVGKRYAQDAQIMGMDLANMHASKINPMLQEQQRMSNETSMLDLDTKKFEQPIKKKQTARSDQIQQMAAFGTMAGNLGSYLMNLPQGLPRETAALYWMQDNGIDPNSQIGQNFLKTDPRQLVGMADEINRRTADYRKAIDVQLLENQGRLQATKASAQGGESIESTLAKQSPAEQMAYWITQATKAQQVGNNSEAIKYWERAQALAPTATAQYYGNNQNVGNVDITKLPGSNLQTVPVPDMLPPKPSQTLGPRNPPAPSQNIEQLVKSKFGSYDPKRYDYRIGPNGQLQRKPKQ